MKLTLFQGFFRRSLSKKGTYTCDWGNNCIVDKFSRTQCQKCRYDKCIAMGMVSNATHIYVPSGQKVKCVVRESNVMPVLKVTSARRRVMKPTMPDTITDLLNPIVRAYRETFTRIGPSRVMCYKTCNWQSCFTKGQHPFLRAPPSITRLKSIVLLHSIWLTC